MPLPVPSRFATPAKISFRWMAGVLVVSRLAFLILRVATLVGRSDTSDFRYFLDMARMSDLGFYPYIHFWAEYPPIFPWLLVGVYRFVTWLAAGPVAEALFYTLVGLFLIACELGVFVLLYRLALLLEPARSYASSRRSWHAPTAAAQTSHSTPRSVRILRSRSFPAGPAWRAAFIYFLVAIPAYIWTGWFDSLPTFLFLLALYLLLSGRERLSAAAVGLGIVSKLFPVLLIPLGLCVLPDRRRRLTFALVSGAVLALFTLPFLVVNPPILLASVRTAFTRPSWETLWALYDRYYSYGVVAPLPQHLDAASADWAVHSSNLPYAAITLGFGLLFILFFWRFNGAERPRQVLAGAAFALTLLLFYSRGYSPQYLTWLAPLLVILYPNRQGAAYLALLGALNMVELLLFISFFPDQHWLLILTVVARSLILTVLAWSFLSEALGRTVESLHLGRAGSRADG